MSKKKKKTTDENRIEKTKTKRKGNAGYFFRKYIFAIVFTALILAYSAYNLANNWEFFRDEILSVSTAVMDGTMSLRAGVASIEGDMTSEMQDRMKYIELFSYVQRVLGKREINNFAYIKDETGSLHYASFYRDEGKDCFEYAMRVKRLQDYVSQYGTDVLFVVAPSKYVVDDDRMLPNMPVNDPQVLVDETLFYLNRLGIETLDLNQYIPNEKVPYEEAFFRTDHHWSIPAAFNATEILVSTLNERFEYGLDAETYLDEENFTYELYHQGMLGSMGRGSGANFSGLDDLEAIYPKFQMDYYRYTLEESGSYSRRRGDTVGTLILPQYLENEDIYKDSQYSLYLNGLRSYESITNETNPDGKKIFMIRDSYFSPVIVFLAPMVGQIDAMWSLEKSPEIDIEQYVRENQFDCIIIEMYPYNIEDDAFQYFKGEEQ